MQISFAFSRQFLCPCAIPLPCRLVVNQSPHLVKTLHQTNYTARREEMLGKCIKGPIFIALGHSNLSFFITAYLVESWFKLSRRRLKCWIVEPCIPVSVRQPIIDCTIQPRSHPSLQLIRRHPGTIGQIFQQITGSHLYPSIPSSVLKPSNWLTAEIIAWMSETITVNDPPFSTLLYLASKTILRSRNYYYYYYASGPRCCLKII